MQANPSKQVVILKSTVEPLYTNDENDAVAGKTLALQTAWWKPPSKPSPK